MTPACHCPRSFMCHRIRSEDVVVVVADDLMILFCVLRVLRVLLCNSFCAFFGNCRFLLKKIDWHSPFGLSKLHSPVTTCPRALTPTWRTRIAFRTVYTHLGVVFVPNPVHSDKSCAVCSMESDLVYRGNLSWRPRWPWRASMVRADRKSQVRKCLSFCSDDS